MESELPLTAVPVARTRSNVVIMDCNQFDTDLFIKEIEKHPPIWGITCPYYKDRNMKKKCWEEVTNIFCPDVDLKEKQNVGRYV